MTSDTVLNTDSEGRRGRESSGENGGHHIQNAGLSVFKTHQLYRRWRCYYYAKEECFLYESCEFYGTLWPNFRKNWPIRFFKGSLPTTNGKLLCCLFIAPTLHDPTTSSSLTSSPNSSNIWRSRKIMKLFIMDFFLQPPVTCRSYAVLIWSMSDTYVTPTNALFYICASYLVTCLLHVSALYHVITKQPVL